jgi:hypothetical protein
MSDPLISMAFAFLSATTAADCSSALEISMVYNLCEFRRRKTQGAFKQLFLEAHQDFGSRAISVSHHARTLFDWEPKIMTLFDIALASSPFMWRRVT